MNKKWLRPAVVVIVALIIIYGFIQWYVGHQAEKTVSRITDSLVAGNADLIKSIEYTDVSASPLDYFSGNFSIEGVSIVLKVAPKMPIKIDSIQVSHEKLDKQNRLASLDLSFTHVVLGGWKHKIYNSLPKSVDKQSIPLLNALNPSANLQLRYTQADKTLTLETDVADNSQAMLWLKVTLANFDIKASVVNINAWQPAVGAALVESTIASSAYKFHKAWNLNAQQVMQEAPLLASTLGSLGYSSLNASVDAKGDFNGRTGLTHNALGFSMANGGKIIYTTTGKQLKALTIGQLIVDTGEALRNGNSPVENNYTLQRMQLDITDSGWLTQANQYFQETAGMSAAKLAEPILDAYAKNASTQIIDTVAALTTFLDKPGSTFEVSIAPSQPFYPVEISNFIQKKLIPLQNQITNLQLSLRGQGPQTKSEVNPAVQLAALNQQRLNLITNFLTRLNYQVTQF